MIDRKLLQRVRAQLRKQAFVPMTPEAQQALASPPPPMPPQGMPMDPAMMGGMPPQGMPMDPAMMGGMPMDPAMMGGMPPAAVPPGGPAILNLEDLRAVLEEASRGGQGDTAKRVTNQDLMAKLEEVEAVLGQLAYIFSPEEAGAAPAGAPTAPPPGAAPMAPPPGAALGAPMPVQASARGSRRIADLMRSLRQLK